MVKVQGQGQIPIRSRVHVYAGSGRSRVGDWGQGARAGMARALARAVGTTSESSTPVGVGEKNFFQCKHDFFHVVK